MSEDELLGRITTSPAMLNAAPMPCVTAFATSSPKLSAVVSGGGGAVIGVLSVCPAACRFRAR